MPPTNKNNIPPHSIESEQAVLGSLLVDNRGYDRITLAEQHFYRDDHRRIYRHIVACISAGKPADVVTISESIERAGEGQQTGGLAYLAELANSGFSATSIGHYGAIVVERWRERALISAANDILEIASARALNAAEKVDRAQAVLSGLEVVSAKREAVPLSEALGGVVAQLQDACDGQQLGISTGFRDIDDSVGGMQPGDLIFVAARPSAGKSALAIQVAEDVARRGGTVLIYSLEMTATQVATRTLSRASRIPVSNIREGDISEEQWSAITDGLAKSSSLPIWIDDNPALTITEMAGRARAHRRRHGLALLIVDYMQLATGHGDTTNDRIAEISKGLKSLAKELSIPVMALSQLSRECERRPDKRPILADLRSSGQLEQDADVVMFIYRDELYNPESPDVGTAEILIRKNRQGRTGMVRLAFFGDTTTFGDLVRGWEPPKSAKANGAPWQERYD